MPLPPIKVIWGTSRQEGNDWLLGLFGRFDQRGRRTRGIVLSARGLLLWWAGLVAAGYFAGAGVLWFWLDRHPHNLNTYGELVRDLSHPSGWKRMQVIRGQAMIEQGIDDVRDKKIYEGLQELSIGLARDPDSTKGRLALAKLYAAAGKERRKVEELLQGGMGRGYPGLDYIREFCSYEAAGENYGLWLAACDTALAQLAGQPQLAEDRRIVIREKMAALLAAGRNDEAVALAEAEDGLKDPSIREARVTALLQAGNAAAAAEFISIWSKEVDVSDQKQRLQVQKMQAQAWRQAGRFDEMNRTLKEMCADHEMTPAPFAYAVVQQLMAARREDAQQTFEGFILRFQIHLENMVLLADQLALLGEEPMIERMIERAKALGAPTLGLQHALVVAQVKNGHWSAAAGVLAAIKPAVKPDDAKGQFWTAWMTALVAAAQDPAEMEQTGIEDMMRHRTLTLPFYRDAVVALRLAGRPETALQVVGMGRVIFPDNDSLIGAEKELTDETNRVQAAGRLAVGPIPAIKPTVPKSETTVPAYVAAGEVPFYRELDALIKAGHDADALERLRAARAARPAWLGANEEEMVRDEILLNAHLHDGSEVTLATALYLTGSRVREDGAVALARQLHDAGDRDEAVLVAREVLHRDPEYQPATRLLAEWGAAPAASPAAFAPPPVAAEVPFFQALDASLRGGNFEGAARQIRDARVANPPWLAARAADLARDEVLLYGHLHDDTMLNAVAGLWLTVDRDRALDAIELAKQLHDAGSGPEAMLLLKAVLQKIPDFPPAVRQMKEWAPAPAK